MHEYIQVTTTVATEEQAGAIAGLLVERRLAACVQVIGPMTSHYRWQGKIEAAIKTIHPYEVAEIVAVPIIAGSKEYLAWLAAEVKEPS